MSRWEWHSRDCAAPGHVHEEVVQQGSRSLAAHGIGEVLQ